MVTELIQLLNNTWQLDSPYIYILAQTTIGKANHWDVYIYGVLTLLLIPVSVWEGWVGCEGMQWLWKCIGELAILRNVNEARFLMIFMTLGGMSQPKTRYPPRIRLLLTRREKWIFNNRGARGTRWNSWWSKATLAMGWGPYQKIPYQQWSRLEPAIYNFIWYKLVY